MQKGQTDLALGTLIKGGDRVIISINSYPDGWWWAIVTEIENRETYIAVDVELETPIQTREIISLYSELLPELPQVRKWEGTRAKHLKARWSWVLADLKAKGKPFDKSAGLDFFRRMFGYIHKSDFLMGRSGGFSCSLPWIVNDENFTKIIEGNYENKVAA